MMMEVRKQGAETNYEREQIINILNAGPNIQVKVGFLV